jgi:hypothetical protein
MIRATSAFSKRRERNLTSAGELRKIRPENSVVSENIKAAPGGSGSLCVASLYRFGSGDFVVPVQPLINGLSRPPKRATVCSGAFSPAGGPHHAWVLELPDGGRILGRVRFVLLPVCKEAIPRPKRKFPEFLDFLGFLPTSLGIVPQKNRRLRFRGSIFWNLWSYDRRCGALAIDRNLFDRVSGGPYN